MTADEFEELFNEVVERSRSMLVEKAKEYASDIDRFHNFNVAAEFLGVTPERALWGFATKHFVSISDMVRSESVFPIEVWDEKIGDALNYLILLRGILKDSMRL